MTILTLLSIGFGLLYVGAVLSLHASVRLALNLKVSKMLIGLTIIAMGTSLPELFVSTVAAFKDNTHLALGNVVGSNIANVGLVLGLAALVKPLDIRNSFSRNELVFVVAAGILLFVMMLNSVLGRLEAVVLLAFFGIFVYSLFKDEHARKSAELGVKAPEERTIATPLLVVSVLVGIIMLVCGADLFVKGAIACAEHFNVPEWIIGLTLVAVGTSIPELATALVAAAKQEAQLVVGNVMGSNVMNFFLILGIAALIRPIEVHDPGFFGQLWFFLFFSILPVPVLVWGGTVSRLKGALLLSAYAGYIYWIKCSI